MRFLHSEIKKGVLRISMDNNNQKEFLIHVVIIDYLILRKKGGERYRLNYIKRKRRE